MKSRLFFTLAVPAIAALLWFHSAGAQVKIVIQPPPEQIEAKKKEAELEKAKAEELARKLNELLVEIELKQSKKQVIQQPLPEVPKSEKPSLFGAEALTKAKELANRIDALLDKKMQKAKVKPAPLAGETEFFRRLHLDLTGQIPTLLEMRDFLENESKDKQTEWTEMLLAGQHYPVHFSHVWASIMLSNRAEANLMPARQLFEKWLQDRIRENQGYDLTARELVLLIRKAGEPGAPNAFTNYHGNKTEDQTGAIARVLLGVKIECAQCHPHPFAEWTKQQFWEFAAFFGQQAAKPAGNGFFLRPEITIPGTGKKAKGKFLDGTVPAENSPDNPKTMLAKWIATKENPYFAKAAADNVWSYFFGASLLEPILEKEKDKSLLTHPELLDLLAKELTDTQFDLKHLVRAIVYTKAYQRTSKGAKNDEQLALFGRMPVRALSADQLFDSFMVATNSKVAPPPLPNAMNVNVNFIANPVSTERTQFLLKFYDTAKSTESTTSILQALFLMNNKFLSNRIDPAQNSVLSTLANTPGNAKRQLETLFLLALSRPPTPQELQQLVPFIESGGTNGDRAKAFSDVLWALLNSSEFALNH